MAFSPLLRKALLILANALIPLACLIFATGFFPYKPLLPELANFEDQTRFEELGLLSEESNGTLLAPRPGPLFDKVIFMVVDALRSDFVYGEQSGFQYVQSLIRNGGAFPFTAHAAAPTVTMPRVKALTTGSVPSFADLILNLDESDTSSSLATQDTWLAQIRQHLHKGQGAEPGRIAFYGDDTWLKLFPDFFSIHDGTSSFFVSDFTEVDNNVTRHLPSALQSRDWDAMIMHYLGLDHIGHKTGPLGANMLPKQREMDSIVQQIYKAMETETHLKNTILVLAGDHGMNSAGNHGGSAEGETSTALVFASPKLQRMSKLIKRDTFAAPANPRPGSEFHYYDKVQQSDLVPTLSVLLDIPIPKNSLGIVIPDLLDLYRSKAQKSIDNPYLQLQYRNALQVLEVVKATYGAAMFEKIAGLRMSLTRCNYRQGGKLHLQCLWSRAQRMLLAASIDGRYTIEDQSEALQDFLKEAQSDLSATASSYNVVRLLGGLVCAIAATLTSIFTIQTMKINPATIGFLLVTSLYSVMMFASSYVEEEQHIWYWAAGAWLAVLTGLRLRNTSQPLACLICGVILLALHRTANRWNQTGQKHAGEPDIARTFLPQNLIILAALAALTYNDVLNSLDSLFRRKTFLWPIPALLSVALYLSGQIFKYNFTRADAPELVRTTGWLADVVTGEDLVFQARLVFALTGLLSIVALASHFLRKPDEEASQVRLVDRLRPFLSMLLLTQSRTTNVPLFLIYSLQFTLLRSVLLGASPGRLLSTLIELDLSYLGPKLPSPSPLRLRPDEATAGRITVCVLLLTYASFFQLGNSNAISSIDLSQAYNGISSYNMGAVGILLFLSNWAGPIWWTTAGLSLLFESLDLQQVNARSSEKTVLHDAKPPASAVDQLDALIDDALTPASNGTKDTNGVKRRKSKSRSTVTPIRPTQSRTISSLFVSPTVAADSPYQQYLTLMTLFTAVSLAATMLACTILRTHLFIWTVFSPKYLYAVAWAVGWHLLVNGVWAGGLWLAG